MDVLELDSIISLLRQAKYPTVTQVRQLCEKAIEVLSKLPNVVSVSPPLTVCGDTHGQFFDLLELFAIGGQCPDTNYLFLGDYVDRGYYSVETFLLLLSLKVRYPNRITLLRGNHESRQTTQAYGFYDEVIRKYNDSTVWDLFNKVFDLLPLCAVIGGKIFCVHGGLSPLLTSVDQIQRLDRKKEIPERGPICDLLWSDPDNVPSFTISPRGAGYLFGDNAVRQFNRNNKLDLILRAHQLAEEGYVEWFNRKLFTVWSAPNYCYRGGNPASILEVSPDCSTKWKMFEAAPPDARGPIPNKTRVEYFM
ncbi:Serine/threonine-protein phosphatase 4 catalytic subunit [Histomonas meleagridis]|uniref:Serine/threonine-protein phosphatase 4 catalytic subunit n=1 Tax=Histomonas meleagridis TaxID=135588 RepID=UPI00355940EF|nr:Serine/threonine-protein phosphatase 4 catalytic subunit [Histomonas meleagridis]KAH0805009.1 Serine/threonine-protein phosphatase 4 catalytic subunit [Histomonas meleagridis]